VGRGRLIAKAYEARAWVRIRARRRPSEEGQLALLYFGSVGLFAAGFGWWVHPALALILLGAAGIVLTTRARRPAQPPPRRDVDEEL